jgi:hypothetical protein
MCLPPYGPCVSQSRFMRPTRLLVSVVVLAHCGTLGAPARGDRDLPSSALGGYSAVTLGASPSGTANLVTADGDVSLEEPSVSLDDRTGLRALFVTMISSDGSSSIARGVERTPGLLDFSPPATVLRAELPWERGAVRSPSAARSGDEIVLAYEAGGAIGLARSTDGGANFTRATAPILQPDRSHEETDALGAPSLARGADGRWRLAYTSGGALFLAVATEPNGPWRRVGTGPIAVPATAADGGVESLDDPALLEERTAAGRTTLVLAASARSGATGPAIVVGFASWDGEQFVRAERPLYTERALSIRTGSFDRVDARTLLLWVSRPNGARRAIGALVTPGGLRVGNPLRP